MQGFPKMCCNHVWPVPKLHMVSKEQQGQAACDESCKVIHASKVIWSLRNVETTSLTLPDAFSTSTYLLISSAKCTINRLHVPLLYLITALCSGNAARRDVRFRKSHSSTGSKQVWRFKKTNVNDVLMVTQRRKNKVSSNSESSTEGKCDNNPKKQTLFSFKMLFSNN